jgi:hypothetical protein
MKKLTNIVLLALIAIAVVTICMWLFAPNPGGAEGGPDANVSPMLIATFIFLVIAAVLLVVMTAMNMGKGKGGNGMLNLIVFGGLVLLAVICWYAFGDATPVTAADGTTVYDDTFTLKATDTGLYVTYFALLITLATLLWGVVRKALK